MGSNSLMIITFILYNNKIKVSFSTGEWILVVGVYVSLDRNLPFLYGVNALQVRTSQISQIIFHWSVLRYNFLQ